MRKKIIIFCLFFLIVASNQAHSDSFKESTAIRGGAKAYYPEKINVFEPFKAKIVFTDEELIENLEEISITDCEIPFEIAMNLKESDLEISGIRYRYNKEKEIDIWLSPITSGKVDMIRIDGELKLNGCDIWFKGENINDQNYIGIDVDYYPYSFGIKNLPDGFSIAKKNEKDLWVNYERKGSDEVKLLFNAQGFRDGSKGFYSFEELKTDAPPGHKISSNGYQKELLTLNGKPAVFWHTCDTYENHIKDEYGGSCRMYASILMPIGPVWAEMNAKQISLFESEGDMLGVIEDWKSLFLDAVSNIYFESQGKNADFVIEEGDDYCGECKQGYTCGACGKCIKESDAVDPSKVDISMDLEIKNDGKRILNAIDSNLAFTVYPNLKITYEGKNIDYCDLKEPGIEVKIDGKLMGNDTYSGFTSGFPSDPREQDATCEIDFEESKPRCVFIVSPSSRKKFIADAKEITDEYKFTATVENSVIKGDRTEEKIAKLRMEPPKDLSIELKSRGTQVQQGNTGVLDIKPKGGTTEKIIIKASLLGPGKIGISSDSINSKWVLKSVNQKETIKLGYTAPPLGNFDIGKELASLSMVDLQKKAAEQIAIDAATAYAGEYMQNVEDLVGAGKLTEQAGHVAKEFSVINGVRNIKGVHDSIPGSTEELGDAMGVNEGKGDATWVENAADVGIVGISAAQTAVGVLTFIPNKIPYVDKLSAGFQSAFSAATNIWKANLQYISKSEKINRARELYYPVAILVTAQDISGWTTQEMHIFKIAYHEIK
jgi:hypothetical protein